MCARCRGRQRCTAAYGPIVIQYLLSRSLEVSWMWSVNGDNGQTSGDCYVQRIRYRRVVRRRTDLVNERACSCVPVLGYTEVARYSVCLDVACRARIGNRTCDIERQLIRADVECP